MWMLPLYTLVNQKYAYDIYDDMISGLKCTRFVTKTWEDGCTVVFARSSTKSSKAITHLGTNRNVQCTSFGSLLSCGKNFINASI